MNPTHGAAASYSYSYSLSTETTHRIASSSCEEYKVTLTDAANNCWKYHIGASNHVEHKLYIGSQTVTMAGYPCSQQTATVCLDPGTYWPFSCGGYGGYQGSFIPDYSWTVGAMRGQGSTSCSNPVKFGSFQVTGDLSAQAPTTQPTHAGASSYSYSNSYSYPSTKADDGVAAIVGIRCPAPQAEEPSEPHLDNPTPSPEPVFAPTPMPISVPTSIHQPIRLLFR